MADKVNEYIDITNANDIKVDYDSEHNPYTNESLFEFLINRGSNVLSNVSGSNSSYFLDVGEWAKSPVPLNIQKLCEIINMYIGRNLINTNSKHQCAKYIREYLQVGFGGGSVGEKALAGHPIAAKDYSKFLPKIGFKKITELAGRSEQAKYTANSVKPGDIAVMNHGDYGHICVWNGTMWVSDFIQRNVWPYQGDGLVYIFRYANA